MVDLVATLEKQASGGDVAALDQLLADYGFTGRIYWVATGRFESAPPRIAFSSAPLPAAGGVTPASDDAEAATATRVVRGFHSGFRDCYNAALRDHHDEEGYVRVVLEVGEDGAVQSVRAASRLLQQKTVDCVLTVAGTGRFDRPKRKRGRVIVPVTFVKQ
jgi:hypothetical protein